MLAQRCGVAKREAGLEMPSHAPSASEPQPLAGIRINDGRSLKNADDPANARQPYRTAKTVGYKEPGGLSSFMEGQ